MEKTRQFNLNIREAEIYQTIKWERYPIFRFAKFFRKLFFILFIIVFLFFLFGFLSETFSQSVDRKLLGLSLASLVFYFVFQIFQWLFNLKLKKPKLKTNLQEVIFAPEEYNLAEFLDFEAAKVIYKSIRFTISRNIPEVNSDILFYFLLTENPKFNFIFSRLILDLNEFKKNLRNYLLKIPSKTTRERRKEFSQEFQKTILQSLKIAQKKGKEIVGPGEVLIALSQESVFFKKLLIEADLKTEDVENLVFWLECLEEKIEKNKKFWEYENLLKRGALAKEWLAGYTITLDKFSMDLTEKIRKWLPEIIGHQEEIKQIERILAQREINNVLLVGEAGTGRKSIISALAKKSLLGQSLPEVNYKRVVELDLPALLAQLTNPEEAEMVLDEIFQEVVLAGNVILVINEFHNFIAQPLRPGVIDISGILSKYLHLPQFQIIAITAPSGLHQYIEQNPSISALFEKVAVSGISLSETLRLLENLTLFLEKKYKIFISYPALRRIISLTERYLPAFPFPEKAIDLLDNTAIYVAAQIKEKVVLPLHVDAVFRQQTQIPVGELEVKEKEILLNLEQLIHQRIINQEEAVTEISSALRRARSGITIRNGPMGCFLFLGPTGVGKTETSKALAEIYFGSEAKMLRLDMSEFQAIEDIPRLLGLPGKEGLLTTPVRENPFSLILLDEIEKAHPNILNLFLQVFDEGHLTDGQHRKVDFRNTIIIATSNAGAEIIWKDIELDKKLGIIKEDLFSYLFEKAIFRPELINRFDGVVVFRPLTKENLLKIAELLLQKLKKNLLEKGIEFVITQALKEKIAELGYEPQFGARAMRRVIQNKVENVLATALLLGKFKKGAKIEIDPDDFTIRII